MCCLFDGAVYNFFHFGKYLAWREHLAPIIRAVDADELRVEFALLSVDVAYSFLELDVCLVDVLCAFEVVSVGAASIAAEL